MPFVAADNLYGDEIIRRYREQMRELADRRIRNNPQFLVSNARQLAYYDPPPVAALVIDDATMPIEITSNVRTLQPEGRLNSGDYYYVNPNYVQPVQWNGATTPYYTTTTPAYNSTDYYVRLSSTAATVSMQMQGAWHTFATTVEATGQAFQNFGNAAIKYDDAPRKRAKRLLYSYLTDYQKRMYRQRRYFHVISESGKKYRLRHGDTMNIYLLEDGKPVKKYCIHPRGVPVEDTLLAQKLMLETDEAAFLKKANKFTVEQHELAA